MDYAGTYIGILVLLIILLIPSPQEKHIHEYRPIPYGMGLKPVYVQVCLTDSMMVNMNGEHHSPERFKEIVH